MGVRPVDMQVVVQKAAEIHPAKQSVVSKQDNELQQTQAETQNDTEEAKHTVIASEETRQNAIGKDKDGQNDDGLFGKGKKKKKKKEEEENEVLPPDPYGQAGTHFDMKV